MSTEIIIIIILALASLLQGITGFGFALIAAPLISSLVGPQNAVVLFTLISLIINGQLAFSITSKPNQKILFPLIAGSAIGLPLGLLILLVTPAKSLLAAISWITLGLAAAMLILKPKKFQPTTVSSLLIGVFLGILHSSVGVNGPLLVIYLSATEMKIHPTAKHWLFSSSPPAS